MSQPCGCCAGIQIITPQSEANPPGMSAINFRVGTYATFYETMLARLSTLSLNIPSLDGSGAIKTIYPLKQLTTREPSDPSIALLDAWAIVADVVTFYQERIANEGYLGTAIERRSVLELARLVNYTLRPGVSSSVYLAFTVQTGFSGTIPAGTRAQSMPGSGQMPQFYESSADLDVSDAWNDLQPRLTRPQVIAAGGVAGLDSATLNGLYFQSLTTNLKLGDGVIIVGDGAVLRVVDKVTPQATEQRTHVHFSKISSTSPSPSAAAAAPPASSTTTVPSLTRLDSIVDKLALPPSMQPRNSIRLPRAVGQVFAPESDTAPRLLAEFNPAAASTLYQAWAGITPTTSPAGVYAARVKCGIFANNFAGAVSVTQTETRTIKREQSTGISLTTDTTFTLPTLGDAVRDLISGNALTGLPLDAVYDQIAVGSPVAIIRPVLDANGNPTGQMLTTTHTVGSVQTVSRETASVDTAGTTVATGYTAKVTQLSLNPQWLSDVTDPAAFQTALASTPLLRTTVIYAQAEELALAEKPIYSDVGGSAVELDGLYSGLKSGRWVIVSGNRTDIPGTTGVPASELVMIAGVSQETPLPGDTVHTSLNLANTLAYTYDRSTVTISGNVAAATNGQTVGEVLGNGDASQGFQTFALHQEPLTYLSASTPAGAQSTLTVTVNEIAWEETDDLSALGPNDHAYITLTDDSAQTTVIFGNGENGARLPTGTANVKAIYRYGMGSAGNVDAQQISQLATHPLGLQSVTNPLPATGGADPDTANQARRNTPLAVKALDRLVSVQDYADFSRSYAGIGKAASVKLSNGRRQVVFVTIAGVEDIPIAMTSDLYQNLVQALQQFGDPQQPILVGVRKAKLLVIAAGIQVLPGYQFEDVEPNVRAALLDTFSFDQRNLGQTAFLSEAISAIQEVNGVAFVNITVFDSVAEDISATALAVLNTTLIRRGHVTARLAYVDTSLDPTKLTNPTGQQAFQIQPAEIAYLTPDIPDTLILTEITPTNPGPPPALRPERRKSRWIRRLGGHK